MEYSIFDALGNGFRRIVFVIREEQEEAFRSEYERKLEDRCDLDFVCQSPSDIPEAVRVSVYRSKPWGTGHAVWSCRHSIAGPFAVVNADDFYGRDSFGRVSKFLESTADSQREYALVGFDLKRTLSRYGAVSRGVCRVDEEGLLVGIEECTNVEIESGEIVARCGADGDVHLPDRTIASMNMWAFPKGFFDVLEMAFSRFLRAEQTNLDADEFYLPAAVDLARAEQGVRVHVLPTSETWMGLTFPEDVEHVRQGLQRLVRTGVYPEALWGSHS
jgi:ADP-ribose pyrophosphatase YjhB (NUDIX family)